MVQKSLPTSLSRNLLETQLPIPILEINEHIEALGFWYAPNGDGIKHIQKMTDDGLKWVDKLQTKPLPARDAWLSFHPQLYPVMVWGLLAAIIKPTKLEEIMQGLYYKILPLLRVNCNITKDYRMILTRYHGLEMPNFVVHCFAAKVFLL